MLGEQRKMLAQQFVDLLLALAMLSAHETMRVDLDEAHLAPGNVRHHFLCHRTGKCCLSCSRWSIEEYQAVKRGHVERELRPKLQAEKCVVQQPVLHRRSSHDRPPQTGVPELW